MKDKIFTVTVELQVYGQTSKAGVLEWLEDALHVDGMFVTKTSTPIREQNEEPK